MIDIEASGFGRGSFPIEIGYARDDGECWCSLVLPQAHWTHWDPRAEALHGISAGALLLHGRTAREVSDRLNTALGGRTVYCDGWAHDYSWLAVLFDAADRVPAFRLESVHALLDDDRLARLDGARQQAFDRLGITRHRASSDARALQWALDQLAS